MSDISVLGLGLMGGALAYSGRSYFVGYCGRAMVSEGPSRAILVRP